MQGSAGPEVGSDISLVGAVLESAPQGFSVWDHDERLIVRNRAYLEMYGFAPDDVPIGLTLAKMSELTLAAGNHRDTTHDKLLEHFRDRLRSARDSNAPVRSQKPIRGRVIATTHTYRPSVGWVVMHEDITEQTEQKWLSELTEKSLDTQSRRFNAALENMSHGLSIFDASMRIVICNKRYLEIYRLDGTDVGPGTPLRRIAELRDAAGTAPADMPDFVDQMSRAEPPPVRFMETSRLVDGRSIQVTRSPIEGGGFVAVHQDITADIERLDALEASHSEIALQKMRFEGALANISHGLSMYDAEGRLVISNKRYQQIYGAPDELCQPGVLFKDIVARRDSPDGFHHIPRSRPCSAKRLRMPRRLKPIACPMAARFQCGIRPCRTGASYGFTRT
jgi:PAS domain-containing protein